MEPARKRKHRKNNQRTLRSDNRNRRTTEKQKQPREKKSLFARGQSQSGVGDRQRRTGRYRKQVYALDLQIDSGLTQFALVDQDAPASFEEIYTKKVEEAKLQPSEELHYIGNGVFAVFLVKRVDTKIEKFTEVRRLEPLEKPLKTKQWQKELWISLFPEHTMQATPLYQLYKDKNIVSYFD